MTNDEIELQKLNIRASVLFSYWRSLHRSYCDSWNENLTWERVTEAKLAYNEIEEKVQELRNKLGLPFVGETSFGCNPDTEFGV